MLLTYLFFFLAEAFCLQQNKRALPLATNQEFPASDAVISIFF